MEGIIKPDHLISAYNSNLLTAHAQVARAAPASHWTHNPTQGGLTVWELVFKAIAFFYNWDCMGLWYYK